MAAVAPMPRPPPVTFSITCGARRTVASSRLRTRSAQPAVLVSSPALLRRDNLHRPDQLANKTK